MAFVQYARQAGTGDGHHWKSFEDRVVTIDDLLIGRQRYASLKERGLGFP